MAFLFRWVVVLLQRVMFLVKGGGVLGQGKVTRDLGERWSSTL
jgi:hypothetical protein